MVHGKVQKAPDLSQEWKGEGEGSLLALLKYQVRSAVQNTAALHFLHLC